MNKIIKIIKNLFPYLTLIIFSILLLNYYQDNKDDFGFLKKINLTITLKILSFALLYMVTETLILMRITKFFKKKISFFESFGVMSSTYLCNTFIQFSGLGFRAYYLKKKKKINISEFVTFSIFAILIELLTFSFFGLVSILIFDFFNDEFKINLYIKIVLSLIFFGSLVLISFFDKIYKFINIFYNFGDIKLIKNIDSLIRNNKKSKLRKHLFKLAPIFVLQFILLTLVFYSAFPVLGKPNGLIFSIITSTLADFSFIFILTPYSIGISEFFIYIGTINFEIKLAEILFLMNTFRFSMLLFFVPFGLVFLFISLRKK